MSDTQYTIKADGFAAVTVYGDALAARVVRIMGNDELVKRRHTIKPSGIINFSLLHRLIGADWGTKVFWGGIDRDVTIEVEKKDLTR